jgi:hypothetical protein
MVRKMRERSISFTVRAHSQEIIGRRGCFTAAAKNRPCALALIWLRIGFVAGLRIGLVAGLRIGFVVWLRVGFVTGLRIGFVVGLRTGLVVG